MVFSHEILQKHRSQHLHSSRFLVLFCSFRLQTFKTLADLSYLLYQHRTDSLYCQHWTEVGTDYQISVCSQEEETKVYSKFRIEKFKNIFCRLALHSASHADVYKVNMLILYHGLGFTEDLHGQILDPFCEHHNWFFEYQLVDSD